MEKIAYIGIANFDDTWYVTLSLSDDDYKAKIKKIGKNAGAEDRAYTYAESLFDKLKKAEYDVSQDDDVYSHFEEDKQMNNDNHLTRLRELAGAPEQVNERPSRQHTEELHRMMDEGEIDPRAVADMALMYMSDDDVGDMMDANELSARFKDDDLADDFED